MFFHLSVSHSVQRGWCTSPLGRHPPEQAAPPPGRHSLGQTPPWADTPKTATEAGSTHPTGMHSC